MSSKVPPPPLLYQVNTRILLRELSRVPGRHASLDEVPDSLLDAWAAQGFGWIWFLGLWQTGEAGRRVSRTNQGTRKEAARTLSDLKDEDITGSPFAVREYHVHADFGDDQALARLRRRLADRGLRLVADFVVNHVAPDHGWVDEHPEWFIAGTGADRAAAPGNWISLPCRGKNMPAAAASGAADETSGAVAGDGDAPEPQPCERILAHGRDPYFPGWADTLQLNLRHPGCREALRAELMRLAEMCDGLRCDMAMLAQNDVFEMTWGALATPSDGALPAGDAFWPESIRRVKAIRPDFLFIAEVYWDREASLQAEGFDFTYDKRLYDRLRDGEASAVRGHLGADPEYQARSLRFLENHDEERAAAVFPPDRHKAAALVTFLVPGMRLLHHGQEEGRQVKVSMHVGRRPEEPAREEWKDFYARLLSVLGRPELEEGGWRLLPVMPAWEGNPTADQCIAFAWNRLGLPGLVAVANYGPHQGQCHVRLETAGFTSESLRFKDLLSDAYYVRKARELSATGMYFDMPPWGFHLFEIL